MTTWLPLPKAAARLGIHKRTLLRWYQTGLLPTDALMQTPTGRWLVNPEKVPGLTERPHNGHTVSISGR